MAGMDLFLPKHDLSFEKAAAIDVDEDPANWTRQIMAELYKTIPDIAEYMATVVFHKKDDKQGYALAGVLVENGTDSALAATRVGGNKPVRVVIPVIIRQYQLMPMDLLIGPKGQIFPLTPDRLREALFKPDSFEALTHDWGDASLYNLFYPPGRLGGGADVIGGVGSGLGGSGGTNYIMGPGMKYAQESSFDLLDAIVPTLVRPDIDRMAAQFEDPAVKTALERNPVLLMAVSKIAAAEDDAVRTALPIQDALVSMAQADVVQIGFDDSSGKYWLKTASRESFVNRSTHYLDRGELLKIAGDEVTQKVDTQGTVTLAEPMVEDPEPDPTASRWKIVDEPGIYKVRSTAGKEMLGWVLPNLLDLDGTRMPVSVFTNGAVSMTQDQILGARVATGVDLPSSPVQGHGVFYAAGQGGVEATVPVMILSQEEGEDGGCCYMVESLPGTQSRVCVVPGLVTMQALDGELFLPPSARFIAMDDEEVPLVSTPEGLNKTAAHVLYDAQHAHVSARDVGAGRFKVAFRHAPKLAQAVYGRTPWEHPGCEQDGTMDRHGAAWVMALAGVSPKLAYTKLAEASHTGEAVEVMGFDLPSLWADTYGKSLSDTAAVVSKIAGLRRSLVKEAATLPDAMTVDAVLSLGFINPENTRLFIQRLPYLEKALSMICECVLASRLGLSVIPEGAASRAARGLDATITGLRGLSLFNMEQST